MLREILVMLLSLFVLALAGGPKPLDGASDYVVQLGAARYVEREAASTALLKLGRSALPSLRIARDSHDLEVRTRARGLVDKIEGELLLEPTMVSLDFADATLMEVARKIEERCGLRLKFDPAVPNTVTQRRVSLNDPLPVSFWQAVDRIAATSGLWASNVAGDIPGRQETSVLLYPAPMRTGPPHFDQGPFRIQVAGLHYANDLTFTIPPTVSVPPVPAQVESARRAMRGAPSPSTVQQFSVRLLAQAEPRLALSQNGAVKLTAARDDLNQSLLETADVGITIDSVAYTELNASSSLSFQIPLKRPAQPGKRITLLKGSVPITVQTRKSDPLSASLTSGLGKTTRSADANLTIHSVQPLMRTRQLSVELTLHGQAGNAASEIDPVPGRVEAATYPLEIVDSEARPVPWYLAGTSVVGNESRLTLVTLPSTTSGDPVELRCYSTIRKSTRIDFEFRDLPMP